MHGIQRPDTHNPQGGGIFSFFKNNIVNPLKNAIGLGAENHSANPQENNALYLEELMKHLAKQEADKNDVSTKNSSPKQDSPKQDTSPIQNEVPITPDKQTIPLDNEPKAELKQDDNKVKQFFDDLKRKYNDTPPMQEHVQEQNYLQSPPPQLPQYNPQQQIGQQLPQQQLSQQQFPFSSQFSQLSYQPINFLQNTPRMGGANGFAPMMGGGGSMNDFGNMNANGFPNHYASIMGINGNSILGGFNQGGNNNISMYSPHTNGIEGMGMMGMGGFDMMGMGMMGMGSFGMMGMGFMPPPMF